MSSISAQQEEESESVVQQLTSKIQELQERRSKTLSDYFTGIGETLLPELSKNMESVSESRGSTLSSLLQDLYHTIQANNQLRQKLNLLRSQTALLNQTVNRSTEA
eukprot:TRINITY_DN6310_c0_g1_i1.p1 TRINITY_DN6310_c0_g1~~TRINITY_DN6310_c0_g1_i1.p1  ORF type:complete len:106 (-),score=19.33 TRINITY_DN6310_c0_g1_i1:82-399(-)